jgi:ribosome-binding factor A
MPRPTRQSSGRSSHRGAPRAVADSRPSKAPAPASQRQLRAGELVRHALAEILRQDGLLDPALVGVSVTLTEVKMTPDLRNALCFVEPLGGVQAAAVVAALNRSSKFLRGKLGHVIDMKFTPDLKFVHDDTFDAAARMSQLFEDPRVRADLEAPTISEDAPGDNEPGDDGA